MRRPGRPPVSSPPCLLPPPPVGRAVDLHRARARGVLLGRLPGRPVTRSPAMNMAHSCIFLAVAALGPTPALNTVLRGDASRAGGRKGCVALVGVGCSIGRFG